MLHKREDGGRPTPALDSMPELWPHNEEVWRAYAALNQKRPSSGFGLSPISTEEIRHYIDIYQIEDAQRFIELINSMDRVQMNWVDQKVKERTKDKGRGR